MNGQSYKAGRFSGSIRRHLFREHLGLLEQNGRPKKGTKFDVSDPASDAFWNKWKDIARRNTNIYENVIVSMRIFMIKLIDYNIINTARRILVKLARMQLAIYLFAISAVSCHTVASISMAVWMQRVTKLYCFRES